MVLAIAIVTALIVVDRTGSDRTDPTPTLGPTEVADLSGFYTGIPSSGMSLGNADAPIVVIEYADYQCPFCANFALNLEPSLVQQYVTTGQVRFEFRPMPILSDLPLDDPANESVLAAEAAMCAADQGLFWSFHHLLYSKQHGENVGTFNPEALVTYAREGGLDVDAFTTCLAEGTHKQDVIAYREQGDADKVSGTPTFLVNDIRLLGYARLTEEIDLAIAAENQP